MNRHNTLERMLACPASYVVADGSRAMMAFLIRHDAWRALGPFDEVFWPIYHEDNDYFRRAELAGISIDCPASDGFFDSGPSASKAALTDSDRDEWDRQFDACRSYYLQKWGGLPYQETYRLPFDGDESQRAPALAGADAAIASFVGHNWGTRS